MSRLVVPDAAHHITQRGNYRQQVFFSAPDRRFFLDRLIRRATAHRLELVGWCLMPNHFHLIAVPRRPDSLALTLRPLLSEYSMRVNANHQHLRGHLWQSRFYSCALKESHLWRALRYVEMNPVRAGLVRRAEEDEWSTARFHVGAAAPPVGLDLSLWGSRYTSDEWADVLMDPHEADVDDLRRCTRLGKPWGDEAFVRELEARFGRRLELSPPGRPSIKPRVAPAAQSALALGGD